MKRICIYCEKWASGGIESFLLSMLQTMDRTELQIDLVSSCIEDTPFTERLRALGVSLYELSGNRNRVLSNRKLFLQLMKVRRYDVLHVNAFHGAELYYLSLGKKAGIPRRIGHAHNSGLRKSKLRTIKMALHNAGKAMYAKYATDLWACSKVAARFLFPQSMWDSVTQISNGIDIIKFTFSEEKRSKTRLELGIRDETVLGNTGRLCQQKNQKLILEIFHEFLKIHPQSKLLLVGDGEDKNSLIGQADTLGIGAKVIFTGNTSHVENYLCAMDVFLFPSVFEGLGISAIEAQAAGLPMVCSDQVPMEAMLMPAVQRLAVDADLGQWVQAVETCRKMPVTRENCAAEVKSRGYDMRETSTYIKGVYVE